MNPPILWAVAGNDTAGGAGLSADQRAAEAFEVHACPVVAGITAQHSRAVTEVEPVTPALLDAQLAALADDLPPAAVKTGLLGSAENVQRVAHWIDRLRERGAPVALVVDPVLGASTGRTFADEAVLQAYRQHLLPRTTLLTPNRSEAARLLGPQASHDAPQQARALRAAGCTAVAITGGDLPADASGLALDWIDTPQAGGWLALPRLATPHHHGTGCTFASSAAAALAQGFVAADALVLAKMATAQALRRGHAAGRGAGPVKAAAGFGRDPALMPMLSWSAAPRFAPIARHRCSGDRPLGLYVLLDDAERTGTLLALGVRTLQLRLKTAKPSRAAVEAFVHRCRAAGALGFVNDHWALALACGAQGVHMGQEDLLALDDDERDRLSSSGIALGISSHSPWELARARALQPHYIACGPVWPTTTKAMPWRPQGLDNLAWWCAVAGVPVVAIGGMLTPAQVEAAARCGATGVCVVRGVGEQPARTVPPLQLAWLRGHGDGPRGEVPPWPHPTL